MNRKTLINILQNVFQPAVNQAIEADLIGASKLDTTLTDETAVTLDFTKNKFHSLVLGSDNITLNATVAGLKPGEQCFLKITQDATAARTVTWGTGIKTGHTISSTTDDQDMLTGIFDGTNIFFGTVAKIAI